MIIDCDGCQVRPAACGDCMVSVLIGVPEGGHFMPDEARAFGVLAEAGLVPPLQLVDGGSRANADARRTGAA